MDKSPKTSPSASPAPITALGIFAKEPLPGRVKTRLCPPLTATEASELYRVMLEETVARMRTGPFAPILFYSGDAAYFRHTFPGIPLIPQAEGDLGRRMEQALGTLFDAGYCAAALIGSDSPDLSCERVSEAFAALGKEDVVTVPATDGGYVLIGERRHQAALFREMPWSTPQVLSETRSRAKRQGIAYRELAPWEDVDDLPSLRRLLRRSPTSASAVFARDHLGHHL